jgi:hypothetical protein
MKGNKNRPDKLFLSVCRGRRLVIRKLEKRNMDTTSSCCISASSFGYEYMTCLFLSDNTSRKEGKRRRMDGRNTNLFLFSVAFRLAQGTSSLTLTVGFVLCVFSAPMASSSSCAASSAAYSFRGIDSAVSNLLTCGSSVLLVLPFFNQTGCRHETTNIVNYTPPPLIHPIPDTASPTFWGLFSHVHTTENGGQRGEL